MAKRGPAAAAQCIIDSFDVLREPTDLTIVLVELAVTEGWYPSRDEAAEATAPWVPKVERRLRSALKEAEERGRHVPFGFNSVSDYMLQGSSYAEESDSGEVKEAKLRRSQAGAFMEYISSISPREFEGVCRGILELLGCDSPRITRHSGDQGIDFFGRLRLEGRLANASALPGLDRNLAVWMVGQAKHFQLSHVSTPDLRELVGSIELAKTRTFSDTGSALEELTLSPLDPVFYLFITTGRISRDGWSLAARSGMIAMDGEMVVNFLSENGVGIRDGEFAAPAAGTWIKHQLA